MDVSNTVDRRYEMRVRIFDDEVESEEPILDRRNWNDSALPIPGDTLCLAEGKFYTVDRRDLIVSAHPAGVERVDVYVVRDVAAEEEG